MAFRLRCPTCNAPLRIATALTRKLRVICPQCRCAFHTEVQLVPVGAASGKRPAPQRRGTRFSESGVPSGPPPALPIRRAVVWGGVATCGAVSLLLIGLLRYFRPH